MLTEGDHDKMAGYAPEPTERMTDKRLAAFLRGGASSYGGIEWELLQALKAERAKLLAIETLLPEWERKPMSDWESVYVGPQHGRNECARKIRSILKEQSDE